MKAKDFEAAFERCEDLTRALDMENASRASRTPQRIDIELPTWIIESLDRVAARLNESRESVIKILLAERLEGSVDKPGDDVHEED